MFASAFALKVGFFHLPQIGVAHSMRVDTLTCVYDLPHNIAYIVGELLLCALFYIVCYRLDICLDGPNAILGQLEYTFQDILSMPF